MREAGDRRQRVIETQREAERRRDRDRDRRTDSDELMDRRN